jgi:hypothetical protein
MNEQIEPIDQEQRERDFANEILDKNKDLLEQLTRTAGQYASAGRSDQLYILVAGINATLRMAQSRVKMSLGIDGASVN